MSKFNIDISFISELTNVNHTVLKTVTNFKNDLKTQLAEKMTETKKNMSDGLKTELTNKMMETKKNMSDALKRN